jgi:hypothetical protein
VVWDCGLKAATIEKMLTLHLKKISDFRECLQLTEIKNICVALLLIIIN